MEWAALGHRSKSEIAFLGGHHASQRNIQLNVTMENYRPDVCMSARLRGVLPSRGKFTKYRCAVLSSGS